MIRAGSPPRLEDGGLGVAMFDLACGRHTEEATAALVRRWGDDRALAPQAKVDLCVLTCAALAPGIPVARSVCVRLRWAALDHVRVDIEWRGLDRATPDEVVDEALRGTSEVMDALAVRWGVDRAVPGQWIIVDTRPSRRAWPPPPGD